VARKTFSRIVLIHLTLLGFKKILVFKISTFKFSKKIDFFPIVLIVSLVLNLSACSASNPSSIYEASINFRKFSISEVYAIFDFNTSEVSPIIVSWSFCMILSMVVYF